MIQNSRISRPPNKETRRKQALLLMDIKTNTLNAETRRSARIIEKGKKKR